MDKLCFLRKLKKYLLDCKDYYKDGNERRDRDEKLERLEKDIEIIQNSIFKEEGIEKISVSNKLVFDDELGISGDVKIHNGEHFLIKTWKEMGRLLGFEYMWGFLERRDNDEIWIKEQRIGKIKEEYKKISDVEVI